MLYITEAEGNFKNRHVNEGINFILTKKLMLVSQTCLTLHITDELNDS